MSGQPALPLARHQKGLCGHLRIRGEPAALRNRDVSATFGAETARARGRHASFYVAVRKLAFADGGLPRLVISAGGAEASADARPLLLGDANVVEVRVGDARFWVEYRPYGLEPERGDVVRLEPFAACPSGPAVLPRRAPLSVEAAADGAVAVAWDHPTAGGADDPWRCRARLRRSAVFVAERRTWTDALVHEPVNALLDTDAGRRVRPVAAHASFVLAPVAAAARLALQSLVAVGGAVLAQPDT